MNKKTFTLIILIQLFVANSFGQLWYLTRGLSTDELAWAVDADSTGNIYWAIEEKNQFPYWYYNIILFKIAPDAQQIWQSTPFGSIYNDIAFKTTVHGSSVYLSGRTDSTGANSSADGLVLSYNTSNAALNWQYIYSPIPDYGYEEIDGLNVQPDGIYLSGWTKGNTTDEDVLLQKISLSGQHIWTNYWDYDGIGAFDGANGHMAMDNNFLYVGAHVNLFDGSLACFSRNNGAYQWDVTWSNSNNDEVLGLTMSADSMLYTVGYYCPPGNSQTCIKKFTRAGQLKWSHIWGGTGTEDARTIVTDGDSIIYVIGTTSSYGNGGKDIFVLKYDTTGILNDSIIWGGAFDEVSHDAVMVGDYIYITGETQSFGNGQTNSDHIEDGLLLKINGRTMQSPDSTMTNVTTFFFNEQSAVKIYPNPFSQSTTLEITNAQNQKYDLNIYDVFGKTVYQSIINKSTPLSSGEGKPVLSEVERGVKSILNLNLPNGIYFLQIKSDNFA
ncbi:MAG: hypothetical protein A2X08_08960 [Bacteroidetes bacterium GWA2_32_17]|nr:MAG: hypothetical protein A2X08_08960 [Bacteroidetes bacterium GWA2_32_17]